VSMKSIMFRGSAILKKRSKAGILMRILVTRRPFNSMIKTGIYRKIYMRHIKKIYNEYPTPVRVNIEATNLCNADCVMCPRDSHTRKQNIMSVDLFKKIIDDLSEIKTIKEATLSGFGEPFIDKNILEKIKYCKDKTGWKTMIFTNGIFLDESKMQRLIDSGLDVINFSFNGGTKETFEEVMKINFETTKNNIENFVKYRNKVNAKKPFVIVSCILNSKNINDEAPFREMWDNVVDQTIVVTPHNWMGGISSDIVQIGGANKNSFPCRMILEPFINWDGAVSLCCRDYNKFTDFGSVNEKSFIDVWNSEKYKIFRDNHAEGKFESICARCDIPFKEGPTKWWEPV